MPGYTVDWPLATAALSLALSVVTLVRDKFYFKGSHIEPLNTQERHRIVPLEYRRLPRVTKDLFTHYPEAYAGFALFRIPWWNSGDRGGFVHVQSVRVTSTELENIKCSFYAYNDIAAERVVAQPILIRNIPLAGSATVTIEVTYQWLRTSWLRNRPRAFSGVARFSAYLEQALVPDEPEVMG